MKSVLTFRASSIGDSLMGKYFLENIRDAHPEAQYALVVSSRAGMIRDLFAAYPWLTVLEVNRKPRSLWQFFAGGRRDVVVTPYTGGVFGILPKLAARLTAKTLIGYTDRFPYNRFLYDKLIPLQGQVPPKVLEKSALKAVAIPVSREQFSYAYLLQPEFLPKLQLQEKKYVVLHLFAGGKQKSLSPDRNHALIHALLAVLPEDFKLVLTGTPKETAGLGDLPHGARAVHTSVQELAHLIDHAAGMVSLDTGAGHIAAHMKKPLVVLASKCVGSQWWWPEMYPAGSLEIFTCPAECNKGRTYSGSPTCLDVLDMKEVAAKAVEAIFNKKDKPF